MAVAVDQLSEARDILREVAFLDERLVPDGRHHLVLGQRAAAAFQFDANGHLIASEAGPSAVASFTVNPDGTVTKDAELATGQKATCWIVVDGDHVHASNAGSGTLSGYQIGQDGSLSSIGVTGTDAGTVDAAVSADGHYLYVQTGAAGIVDEFEVGSTGILQEIGSVTVPNGIGGEGIVAG